jgi:hypothetical protein
MALVDAEDELLRVLTFEIQISGVNESWARKATAELLAEVGSQDSRFLHLVESGSSPFPARLDLLPKNIVIFVRKI